MSHGIPFILLLQLLFGAVVTGTEKMSALSGTCFTLFSNLASHERISLYRNGKENQAIIARINSSTLHFEILNPNYTEKIFLEMNINLCNLNQTHSAKYIVQYGSNTTGPVKELLIMELSEDQVHKWLKDHPDFMDKYLGKLAGEQIREEVRKGMADHLESSKRSFENLTEDEFEKYLDGHPGLMKKYFGSGDSLMIGLLIAILSTIIISLILLTYIAYNQYQFKAGKRSIQETQSYQQHDYKLLHTEETDETNSRVPKQSKTVKTEVEQSNATETELVEIPTQNTMPTQNTIPTPSTIPPPSSIPTPSSILTPSTGTLSTKIIDK